MTPVCVGSLRAPAQAADLTPRHRGRHLRTLFTTPLARPAQLRAHVLSLQRRSTALRLPPRSTRRGVRPDRPPPRSRRPPAAAPQRRSAHDPRRRACYRVRSPRGFAHARTAGWPALPHHAVSATRLRVVLRAVPRSFAAHRRPCRCLPRPTSAVSRRAPTSPLVVPARSPRSRGSPRCVHLPYRAHVCVSLLHTFSPRRHPPHPAPRAPPLAYLSTLALSDPTIVRRGPTRHARATTLPAAPPLAAATSRPHTTSSTRNALNSYASQRPASCRLSYHYITPRHPQLSPAITPCSALRIPTSATHFPHPPLAHLTSSSPSLPSRSTHRFTRVPRTLPRSHHRINAYPTFPPPYPHHPPPATLHSRYRSAFIVTRL